MGYESARDGTNSGTLRGIVGRDTTLWSYLLGQPSPTTNKIPNNTNALPK